MEINIGWFHFKVEVTFERVQYYMVWSNWINEYIGTTTDSGLFDGDKFHRLDEISKEEYIKLMREQMDLIVKGVTKKMIADISEKYAVTEFQGKFENCKLWTSNEKNLRGIILDFTNAGVKFTPITNRAKKIIDEINGFRVEPESDLNGIQPPTSLTFDLEQTPPKSTV